MLRFFLAGLLVITFFGFHDLKAESALQEDFDLILKFKSERIADTIQHSSPKREYPAELSMLGNGIIKIYQTVVSSQDIEACKFEPSCSRFASDAIRRGGFFKGILLTADRLSRCHLFARTQLCEHHLPPEPRVTWKIYDPPELYLAR